MIANSSDDKELLSSSYDFHLPNSLIATEPVSPRDHSKLLVYNRADKTITHTHFYEINNYLPKETTLILNDTKVIKARLYGNKESGGKIELLINRPLDLYNISVYIKGKVKVDTLLYFAENIHAVVSELCDDGSRVVNFYHHREKIAFESLLPLLEKIGHIPLPPYMQREDTIKDEEDYQSVFAKNAGAIAAPTASLHFSDELFEKTTALHAHAFVTLHVGAGTFKPVESDIITEHPMHSEYYNIPTTTQAILDSDTNITAIGTTSTRTIEYYARTHQATADANLFLHPKNPPIRVNNLITNFHLPKSTLIMLVASFIGLDETIRVYEEAIKAQYRFYSYGDAMLII